MTAKILQFPKQKKKEIQGYGVDQICVDEVLKKIDAQCRLESLEREIHARKQREFMDKWDMFVTTRQP